MISRSSPGGMESLAQRFEIDILPRSVMAKIKMKSNSSAKKRFKLTANGRVKRKAAYLRHNLGAKSTSAKRKLRRGAYVSKTQEHQIKAMLPYA
jgi:large subunit ribosomal protein L35